MPLPTDDLIIWASSDVNLPNLAGPNKVKPIDDLILKGWDFKQKPAADEFNYVLNNLGMHVSYLEESKTYTFSGDVTGTATSTGSDDVTFNVSVTDNSHNHISANISDATSLNIPNMVVRRDSDGSMAANYIRAESYFDGDLHGNANTASALQTARTINGTSFNGSSNITTNSWGASRTFTVNGATTGSANVDGSSNITLTTTLQTLGSNIGILTGTIAHGETIPLPSGFSESQCRWLVSVNNDNLSGSTWDWQNSGYYDHVHTYCSANGTRVVTCYRTVYDETGSLTQNGIANYIIIGCK